MSQGNSELSFESDVVEVFGRVGDNSRDSGIVASSHSNTSLMLAFQK